MKCEECEHWIVRRVTTYDDGSEVERWKSPDGSGHCESLGIETAYDFGCNRFMEASGNHVESEHKPGAPWHHFKMIPCPDCGGKGDGTRGHRCAGTGLVRLYDDGYIGDEQTRKHPKENVEPPKCPSCKKRVELDWGHCPACGFKLWQVAETEIVTSELAGLPTE